MKRDTVPSDEQKKPVTPGNWIAFGMLAGLYLACVVAIGKGYVEASRPCVNNFEGGCSMARGYVYLISIQIALFATGVGAVLGALMRRIPALAPTQRWARWLIVGLPAAYFMYGLMLVGF